MDRESDFECSLASGGQNANAEDHEIIQPLADLARTLHAEGDVAGAVDALEQAIALAPDRGDLYSALGNIWQEANDQEAALACYRKAVELDPDCIPARQNLGYLLYNYGEPDQALEHYQHALAIRPSPMTHLLAATVLPVIYESADELTRWRARLSRSLQELADSGLQVETARSQIPTNFFLAYQGLNDCEIARNLGHLYQTVEFCPAAGTTPLRLGSAGRLRVGFLSAYFHDHTIGRLNLGRIRHLSRDQFAVTVFSLGHAEDELAREFMRSADSYVALPRNVEAARHMIAETHVDVLIFADVGMDSITSTLVFSRMAPVQCVTWGHPDTTGSPTIDYFLSSELLETQDADAHYTEHLVRLPLLGIYYERPIRTEPERMRTYFGLDDHRHVYLCPQTLFKFHPDFDRVLAAILEADPLGDLVLLEGRVRNWTERLMRRFARTLPHAERRVRFLPAQPHDDFLALHQVADVVLDPLHFGGGNSSYEAFGMNVPVVTLPSSFLRGRITQALYQKMGLDHLITKTPQDYVQMAVRLGTQPEYRNELRRLIASRSDRLFADLEEVQVLERFLLSLTGSTRTP